jgi:site-specific recombinase XerD
MKQMIIDSKGEAKQIGALAYSTGARVSELNQICAGDLQPKNNFLEITCPVLKKRLVNSETQRIALVRLDETWLIDPINTLAKDKEPNEKLVPYYRMKIWRILTDSFDINPHGFRKIRATHLAVNMGFSAYQLKSFFGWSSITPSDFYVKLNTKDLRYDKVVEK